MNKVILMGRLTRDPSVKYTQAATPIAVAKYGIAVRRQFARQGEQDVDFFNIIAFGKAGEFAGKFFKKGQMVSVVGRLQVNTWEDTQKVKHTSVDVIAEEQHFAESRKDGHVATGVQEIASDPSNTEEDDDLPF